LTPTSESQSETHCVCWKVMWSSI